MNLGQLLRLKRKEKGLTQGQVAKIIGVSTNSISKYERNIISNMGRTKVIALSQLLDIPTIAFIEAIDEINANSNINNLNTITPKELEFEVKCLVDKTIHISEQGKKLLLQTLEFVCSDEE